MSLEKEVKDIESTAFPVSNTCKVVNGTTFKLNFFCQLHLRLCHVCQSRELQFPIKGVVKEGINRIKERPTQVKVEIKDLVKTKINSRRSVSDQRSWKSERRSKPSRDQVKKGTGSNWRGKEIKSSKSGEISFQSKMMSKPG